LTDDPTRAGELGYVGCTEKADIVRLSVERAPAVKPDICVSELTRETTLERSAATHEQIEQYLLCYGANALCCCQKTVPF
jgi:hypothetical protein